MWYFWGYYTTISNALGKYMDNEDPKRNFSCPQICINVDLEEAFQQRSS